MHLLLTYFYALLFCTRMFYFKLKVKRQGHPKRWNTTLLYIERRNKPENRKLYQKKILFIDPGIWKEIPGDVKNDWNTQPWQLWNAQAEYLPQFVNYPLCSKTVWFIRHWGRNGWGRPRNKKKNVSVIPLFKLDLMYIILQ